MRKDPQLLGAMLLFGASNRIITRFAVEDEVAVGWDVDGKEVARVPFTEPMYTRDYYDEKYQAYRHNTT